ncbi:serine hydrolase domain-containing protein [Parerythrobacter aurantius]|uniref:serine hydrolase domain-containing protein n=1 Tax=Parerythrobacter aurantius TaxID=3127706 RepID=UPI00325699D0
MTRLTVFPIFLLALAAPASLLARDVRTSTCEERVDYVGPSRLAPVEFNIGPIVPDAQLKTPVAKKLDAAFDNVRDLVSAPAMSAAVLLPDEGMWMRNETSEDAPLLFWASAGKMATAVVVLQLVEEGKLSLEDRASRWIDAVPNGDVMTVRDLLAHTAGLYSANEDEEVRATPHFLDLPEQLAIVRRHGALFCPGAAWRYSNTGYSLLGEIVKQVDGRPIDEAITRRIIEPLGLTRMRALPPGGSSVGVAPPVSGTGPVIEASWAGAAGPLASDAGDMTRFLGALLEGRLLGPDTTTAMLADLYPMFDNGTYYGLGLMLFEAKDGDNTLRWIGHAGGTPGAGAIVAYSPKDEAIVAVALTGDGSAAAAANYLLKTLDRAAPRETANR